MLKITFLTLTFAYFSLSMEEYCEGLKKKAEEYSNLCIKSQSSLEEYFGTNPYDGILDYIKGVIDDEDFKKDPTKYLKVWEEERGGLQVYRFLEDGARYFFKENPPPPDLNKNL